MSWYRKVIADQTKLEDALDYYNAQYMDGLNDLKVENKTIWEVSKSLSGWTAFRYGQYRELCAIYDYFELECKKILKDKTQNYLEHYNRALSDRMATQYAEADQDVISYRQLLLEIKLVLEKYEGLTKGLSALNYQLSTLARMREAGIEDTTI